MTELDKRKPLKLFGMSCFDCSLASIVAWEYGHYKESYMYSWNFKFQEGNTEDILTYEQILKSIYGLSLKRISDVPFIDIHKIIKEELGNNRALLIKTNEKYCYWTYNYQNNNWNDHIYMIIGIDEEGNYKCIDAFPYYVDICISKKEFEEGFRKLYTYSKEERVIELNCTGKEALRKCINDYQIFNYLNLQDMEKFYTHILEHSLDELLEEKENVWETIFYKYIDRLNGGRARFLEFLNNIADRTDYMRKILDSMTLIVEDWSILLPIITKAFLVRKNGDKYKTKFANLFLNIGMKEKELYQFIMSTIYVEKDLVSSTKHHEINTKQHFVNLENHKKNKELYFDKEHVLMKDSIPVNKIWNIEDMIFDFKVYGEYDCLCCNGEEINIDSGLYNYIMFLGYATHGEQMDEFVLEYEDKERKSIDVALEDWCNEPRYGYIKAWEGKCTLIEDGKDYSGKIFARKYKLPFCNKKLNKLIIPNNSRIFIYAITFL